MSSGSRFAQSGYCRRLLYFFWHNKWWWLTPMILMLLALRGLVVFAQSSAIAHTVLAG